MEQTVTTVTVFWHVRYHGAIRATRVILDYGREAGYSDEETAQRAIGIREGYDWQDVIIDEIF